MRPGIRPDDLEALAGDDVSELFGWPVGLLDQLTSVKAAANRDEITIQEWRRRDAELRATGPAQFPRDRMSTTCQAAREALLDHDGEDTAEERMLRLVKRLADQVRHLWQAAETQRFLLRETAPGWPEHLREPDTTPKQAHVSPQTPTSRTSQSSNGLADTVGLLLDACSFP